MKYLKIFKIAPKCFGSKGIHHQGGLYSAPRMGVLRIGWEPSQGKQSSHKQRRTTMDVDAPENDGNASMQGTGQTN